jgi:hypothetical protein
MRRLLLRRLLLAQQREHNCKKARLKSGAVGAKRSVEQRKKRASTTQVEAAGLAATKWRMLC